MRVEQQSTNFIDKLQQTTGPQEQEGRITFADIAAEKSSGSVGQKSVNVKDATYLKPDAEEKQDIAEEIGQSAALDAAERKNQMAVLANTTSPEDYARMQEEGFTFDETGTHVIVTETDKIKAQLAKAGVDISVFGDDLDIEQLQAITGSAELAVQIASELHRQDLPLTEDNVREAHRALKLAESLEAPGDGAVKYLLDNGLTPTIENLYLAEHSGSSLYHRAEESVDIDTFIGQVETVIRQAGFAADDQTKADCQWLVDNEIPLTEENLRYLKALRSMEFPMQAEDVRERIAAAVAEGGRPEQAVLISGYTLAARAEHVSEVVNNASDADVAYLIEHDMDLTVQNLEYALAVRASEEADMSDTKQAAAGVSTGSAAGTDAARQTDAAETDAALQTGAVQAGPEQAYTEQGLAVLTARRRLEEARLLMTVQANYSLLKQGISIETEPLERLVEQLKAQEEAYYRQMLSSQGAESTPENIAALRETTEKVAELKNVPAYVLGIRGVQDGTVDTAYKAGMTLRERFEQANERYETLMTVPRADLGDSIQKAFRNVDDILQEIGVEISEENRRAARILGYNNLAINPESIAQMKQADEEVQRVFRNLTPVAVTQLIKRGINPLDMDFASLNAAAEQFESESGEKENRKFSEFLWKLEQNHEISEEERASYIGTYRLIRQVEQTDGAAIGALVSQGAKLTMRNLLTAVRSANRSGKMEYAVDDSFGEREGGGYRGGSVTEQIESAYQMNCLKDLMDDITPERLRKVMSLRGEWQDMTPERLRAALAEVETNDAELDLAYAKEQLVGAEQSAKADVDVYRILEKYDIPNTMANVLAVEEMTKNRNGMFRKIFGKAAEHTGADAAGFARASEQLLEDYCDALSTPEALGEVQERLGELAENVMKGMITDDGVTSLDMREMRLLSAQLQVNRMMAKQEQYSVPVTVGDGVVNVSLKIVRGADKKGIVDITMESALRGKIAATFQAKENGVSGLIATDNRQTGELLEQSMEAFAQQFGGEEHADMHVTYLTDLDMMHFSGGLFGVNAQSEAEGMEQNQEYQVQTTRLYHIAEQFIRQIRQVL